MNDNAFNFQTLHPDTIMDALFEQGIRVIAATESAAK